jgi:4-aminobutyrate aminotransferase-like enzyme/Ser/Thr protein kinase RdoA (MazF antagonist)
MILSEEYLKDLLRVYYELEVPHLEKIQGYEDQNFLITDAKGNRFILKVSIDPADPEFLAAQLSVMAHLKSQDQTVLVQDILYNSNGSDHTVVWFDRKPLYVRVLSYVEGRFIGDLDRCPDSVFDSLGRALAEMDLQLQGFRHPAIYRYSDWDLDQVLNCRLHLNHIKNHEKRTMVDYFLLQYEMEVSPLQHLLRKAVIHSDVNDYNVLVEKDKVHGIIDFGDMVESSLINNLAIACTYAMFRKETPLSTAEILLKSYHEVFPLEQKELSILYYLIAARLCMSVTTSAMQRSQGDNPHHFISEKDAWHLLYQWIKINPTQAQNRFNLCCGFKTVYSEAIAEPRLKQERKKVIGANLSISYRNPIKIVKGALQYLYDEQGNTYIDCVNNVSHVGHCHPVVVKAMQRQIARLNTNTRYLHDSLVEYAQLITSTLPPKLKVCYFCNSGSEANDLAIRISRHYTGQKDVIVLDHAYHGTSTVAMELSPYKFDGRGGAGQQSYVHKGMNPDLYRGNYRYDDPQAGEKYAEDIAQIITKLSANGTGIAAFICETLLGVGGQIPLPEGYLKQVYAHVRAAGGLCIADEVQVGFGRVGEQFWGFELQEVEPDIVVLGKPIGNGHPLAAVVITEEVAAAFNNGMEYFNTYGGNPVSMETGIAVMEVIRNEDLQERALATGGYLISGLQKLMEKHQIIGDVRGKGLFVGAELVRDRTTLEPAVPEIDEIVEEMKERGFLLSTDGPLHNVLKIKPPLVFNIENAKAFLSNLDEVLSFYN